MSESNEFSFKKLERSELEILIDAYTLTMKMTSKICQKVTNLDLRSNFTEGRKKRIGNSYRCLHSHNENHFENMPKSNEFRFKK